MKKLISLLICTVTVLSSVSAFADSVADTEVSTVSQAENILKDTAALDTETGTETAAPESGTTSPTTDISPLLRNKVSVTANIANMPFVKDSDAILELLTTDGVSLGTSSAHIAPNTEKIEFTFDVPQYKIGTSFKVKPVSGLESVLYYEDAYHIGNEFTLPTYSYIADDGTQIESTSIAVTVTPLYDKSLNIYYNGTSVPLNGARIIDGTAMVPIRTLAEFIGFNVRYDKDYNTEVVSLADKYMFFNVDTAYTTIFGNDLFAPYPTTMIDGAVFVSLRTFADAIGSELTIKDYWTHMDINLSESAIVSEYFKTLPINRMNVSSRTGYMVWVSLSEYKVRLYEGRQNQWKPLLEAPCAIGAPGTPTVTGSFEYNYKTRWDYGTYYVGPCLVFYRGYALHSVLLYQNGTEYDGRVGVKISHGCIRLKKKDIDYIANTIPVGTKIYITP